ncbi:MAG: glycosyltransferase family protein [Bacteroidales bacterium]|nr:glycosyltransferase family protein [Bacteroidales bacterium]
MRYLFVVQGEGRGHFTQALSLKKTLELNGHEVVSVMVGCSAKRILPAFFTDKIGSEIIQFQSPNFMPSAKGKKSPLLISILYNLLYLQVFFGSMLSIRKTIKEKQPDVVINFYELMCGFTYGMFNPAPPMVNIAHQYYFQTPGFTYTGKDKYQFELLNFYSNLTSLRATKILALSFRSDEEWQYGNITIVPPLLRQEVMQQEPRNGNYIHGYILNSGYADELADWSGRNMQQALHFFWDKKEVGKTEMLTPMLAMHQLSDTMFLHYMSGCKAYATTGGFESVCEAMYLQKPVLMVPTHIEQECNVIDAMNSDAGVGADAFDLDKLLNFVPSYKKSMDFRYWSRSAETIFLEELTSFGVESSSVFATI